MAPADDPGTGPDAGVIPPAGPSDGRAAGLGAFAGLCLLFAGGGWYVWLDTTSTRTEGAVLRESLDVARVVMNTQTSLSSYLATKDGEFLGRYRAGLGALTQETDQLKDAGDSLDLGEIATNAVNQLNATVVDWNETYAKPAIGLRISTRRSDTSKLGSRKTKQVGANLGLELSNQLESLDRQIGAALTLYRARIQFRKRIALGMTLGGLLLTLGTGWRYIRRRHVMLDHLRSRSARLEEIAGFERRLHHVTSAEQAARLLRASAGRHGTRCAVLLRRDHGPGLRIADETGASPAGAEKSAVLSDHLVCPVMRTGARFAVRDVAVEPACDCPAAAPKSGGYLCEPLLAQGQVAGLVNWQAGPGRVLRDRDTGHVEELARATSLVLSNLFTLEGAQHDANTDPLTGVSNRRFLDGYLAKQVAAAVRQSRPLAVLMLDLDRFKAFNDRHGHPAGDALLRAAAAAMQVQVREGDLVARYGGEEFTVVLPEADRDAALEIAGRIRAGIEAMRVDALPSLPPPAATVSIGVALAPAHGATAGALIHAADEALYRAKQDGRNRVVAASPGA